MGWIGRLLAWLIASLPRRAKTIVGTGIGLLWFDVFRIRRRVAIENVGVAFPEQSKAQRTHLARRSLIHMGQNLVEYAEFPFFEKDKIADYFEFHGLSHLEAASAKGRGVLLLGLHLGNGDFAISALSRLGWSVWVISKLFKAEWLNDLWFGMRKRHGTRFIAPEKSTFEILRALKANGLVIFVLDQFMGKPIGCRTRFFGKETGTAMGLALIAGRTEAPVVPCYTYRLANGKHVAAFEAEIPWQDIGPDAKRDQNIAAMTQVYTDKLEAIIRRHPEQWMWIHRRWKNFG